LSELLVLPDGPARWRGRDLPRAIGRGGIRADKREGDGATPAGRFLFRRLLYRADRVGRPATLLPAAPIGPRDGWCDDPGDPLYNRQVRLPHAGRHELLWREDGLYDLVVVLGHNDDPVRPGRGSAVFLHVAAPGWAPTEGCVALARDDLLELLAGSGPGEALAAHTASASDRNPSLI
jgi:L,D-peptidoglycan transpeptidase YkuD (ErfK/YbiS/YcfS/YnhG family)